MTLLEKAKEAGRKRPRRNGVTLQHAELVVAWLNGEITCNQVAIALGKKQSNSYHALASMMHACVGSGLIRVELTGRRNANAE